MAISITKMMLGRASKVGALACNRFMKVFILLSTPGKFDREDGLCQDCYCAEILASITILAAEGYFFCAASFS